MSYEPLMYMHLVTVGPAALIGIYLFICRKGTAIHKSLGKIYMVLMLLTGVITLLMPAAIGSRLFGHFGFIHLFSLLTLYAVPAAFLAARRGDIVAHKSSMMGLFIGGVLIAGTFAFMPGRILHSWLFGAV
ncbi:DUF2306 domain-containing protein [uncultured Pseudoteredinibacter sp.]|uniref:DUF2306 domain-containing protein n=1 Tax=uncultured Pseudoteredinibacter sp. TaxID=1641701 RepID=UPI00260EAA5F|nr:DUF2306 domain-containing protein [uncultured Pseudoteredinibacter sp.]